MLRWSAFRRYKQALAMRITTSDRERPYQSLNKCDCSIGPSSLRDLEALGVFFALGIGVSVALVYGNAGKPVGWLGERLIGYVGGLHNS